MKKLAIIDYGMGNLMSVLKACEYVGINAHITSDFKEISSADILILPGVGAFADAMRLLKKTGLDFFIKEEATKKPILGICLGMQLLFDTSDEFGLTNGLSLINGDVRKIDAKELKVPHIGWNSLEILQETPLLKGVSSGEYVYFVHSFKAHVKEKDTLLARSDYGGEIAAVVGQGNIFGCQFHPEKSSDVGIRILENFINLI